MGYCASRERFASSSRDSLEPMALGAALVRCQANFNGNFSTVTTRALSRLARLTIAVEQVERIRRRMSFITPAAVIMSPLRFINCGLLRSTENLLRLCGAAT